MRRDVLPGKGLVLSEFSEWWLTYKIMFIDEIPKTNIWELDKRVLRLKYKNLYQREGKWISLKNNLAGRGNLKS